MRHCIPCDAAYENDPAACPVCGRRTIGEAELQMKKEAEEELRQEEMVAVLTLESVVDRAILTQMLDARNIPWVVQGEGSGSAFGGLFAAQDGFGALMVPESEVERARDVIRDYTSSVVVAAEPET